VKIIIQISFALLLFSSPIAFGQHEQTESNGEHDSGGEGHGHHLKKNFIAIFTGATTQLEEDKDTDFTLGLDYVRHFSKLPRWGVGVFGEVIFGKHTEYLFGLPIYFFPTNNFWLRAGPTWEIHKEEEKSESGMNETTTETNFALRTGLGYDFEVKGFVVVPNVSFDFFRDKNTSLVWGLHLGRRF